jgi:hypothetical protein
MPPDTAAFVMPESCRERTGYNTREGKKVRATGYAFQGSRRLAARGKPLERLWPMQPTIRDLLAHIDPADLAVFATDRFIDVRFRLHVESTNDLCLAVLFLDAPERETGLRLID